MLKMASRCDLNSPPMRFVMVSKVNRMLAWLRGGSRLVEVMVMVSSFHSIDSALEILIVELYCILFYCISFHFFILYWNR